MKTLALALSLAVAAPAFAQARVVVDVPNILFPAPPRLVVVEPGIQVVEDHDEEVFFVDNYYWHRRNGHWFRTATHNGGWVAVEAGLVPPRIVAYAPGRYRHWRGPHTSTVVVNPPGPGRVRVKIRH